MFLQSISCSSQSPSTKTLTTNHERSCSVRVYLVPPLRISAKRNHSTFHCRFMIFLLSATSLDMQWASSTLSSKNIKLQNTTGLNTDKDSSLLHHAFKIVAIFNRGKLREPKRAGCRYYTASYAHPFNRGLP